MPETINLSLDQAHVLSRDVLVKNGMSERHAEAVAKSVVQGQRDECHSHGMYRLIVCVRSLRSGRVAGDALPIIDEVTPALTRVDAKFGFAQVAFDMGSEVLIRNAQAMGIAALAINNCYHFSALWQEVEALAERGVAAIAMTPSHSFVAPAGGTKPLFGTNPFAFAWPRAEGVPYVFDFATSVIARGDIELAKRNGKKIPDDWAIDQNGNATDDPAEALRGAMLTFGGHKGSALSAMIELLAGPLIGDLMSFESLKNDGGLGLTPCHGELILAFCPSRFAGGDSKPHIARAEQLLDLIVGQGARLPSQRRFAARERSAANGVHVPRALYEEICSLLSDK